MCVFSGLAVSELVSWMFWPIVANVLFFNQSGSELSTGCTFYHDCHLVVVLISRTCHRVHVFPRLHWFHVSSRLPSMARFPALGTCCMSSRACQRVQDFPRFAMVANFPVELWLHWQTSITSSHWCSVLLFFLLWLVSCDFIGFCFTTVVLNSLCVSWFRFFSRTRTLDCRRLPWVL